MKILLIGGAGALAFGGFALAQEAPSGGRFGDADGDGRVSQAEFLASASERFSRGDADGDGTVSPDEMRAAMEARGDALRDRAFERLDADNDGSITRAEFDQGARGRGGAMRGGGRHGRGPDHAMGADGVTRAEAETRAAALFARMDANGDGYLSPEDRAGRRGGPRGPVSE